MNEAAQQESTDNDAHFDAIIVGAGFAGLYLLHTLRGMGLSVRVYEQADGVGGTWYWNRYPGARCDAESLAYSYSFDPELEQEWEWSERYATQPEILRYIEHVADRLDLHRDIRFERRVQRAAFDATSERWTVATEAGDTASARFLIMATGCLSVPQVPDIPGLDDFTRERHQASLFPDGVDFTGKRVGVIGTGSSAIQAIPVIAETAGELTVFQRSPNYSVPAQNTPLDPGWVARFKEHYRAHREQHRLALSSGFGDLEIEPRPRTPLHESGRDLSEAEFNAICQEYWDTGGARFMSVVGDALFDEQVNERVANFVRGKIREIVKDPETAEALCPVDHPIGTKRICVDTGYYDAYNQPNVELANLRETPIERVTETGVQLSDRHVELDMLVLATGFDAMTGALNRIEIDNGRGETLKSKWSEGPVAYLGLVPAGFQNLFLITGPGSPSVLSNMIVSIEQHVEFVADCIREIDQRGAASVTADEQAEAAWVDHVREVANMTLFPKGGSWYLGVNVPGKPRVFMPYCGGVGVYREVCEDVVRDGYRGFVFSGG